MKNGYFLIGDDIILMEIVGRITIDGEDGNYTLSIFDKSNKFITDIGYEDRKFGESLKDEFLQYLYN